MMKMTRIMRMKRKMSEMNGSVVIVAVVITVVML